MIFLPPKPAPGMSPEDWDDEIADYLEANEREREEEGGCYADY